MNIDYNSEDFLERFLLYFLTYFFSARGPDFRAVDVALGVDRDAFRRARPGARPESVSGSGSGMKAVTLPSFALPIRIPRFQPAFRLALDSESAA